MDNLTSVRNDTGAFTEAIRQPQTWIMSLLYIGTFGSFIGYSFAFGLVLQNEFGRTPLQAAAVTFIGPLLGSLIRPIGGRLADTYGGARVSLINFAAMAVATLIVIVASGLKSLPVFVIGFVVLFVLSGLGNGSTYKMIPAIFRTRAEVAVAEGTDPEQAEQASRRSASALIGIAGAIGAFGGVLVNIAFRQSFLSSANGNAAYLAFIGYYALCLVLTRIFYTNRV
jgi:NNP family nitrate/nitrite transporter-like MFS transporter